MRADRVLDFRLEASCLSCAGFVLRTPGFSRILHVAMAIALDAEVLLTFDKRQRRLARAEKLRVAPRVS